MFYISYLCRRCLFLLQHDNGPHSISALVKNISLKENNTKVAPSPAMSKGLNPIKNIMVRI